MCDVCVCVYAWWLHTLFLKIRFSMLLVFRWFLCMINGFLYYYYNSIPIYALHTRCECVFIIILFSSLVSLISFQSHHTIRIYIYIYAFVDVVAWTSTSFVSALIHFIHLINSSRHYTEIFFVFVLCCCFRVLGLFLIPRLLVAPRTAPTVTQYLSLRSMCILWTILGSRMQK